MRRLATLLGVYLLCHGIQAQTDVTSTYLTNPNFEENGSAGWTNEGMGVQTNDAFSLKNGTAYVEKWNGSSAVPDVAISQLVKELPNGVYTLKAAAQNILQSNTAALQTGAYLFAGDHTTLVQKAGTYSVTFTVVEGQETIGFKAVKATGNWIACDNFRLYAEEGSTDAVKTELRARVDKANGLAGEKMQAAVKTELLAAVSEVNQYLTTPSEEADVPAMAIRLREAIEAVRVSAQAYRDLQAAIDKALTLYGEGNAGAGTAEFDAAIKEAQALADNLEATLEELAAAIPALERAGLAFNIANASGDAPTVVTDTRFARGATRAYGRSTVTGVAASDLLERGFCWSTEPEPTVLDNRSTKYFDKNGRIYCMENLKPSTVYYARAYAMTKNYAVGYGDVIKIITIPKGNISYWYNFGGPSDSNARIDAALAGAVNYWNELTSIRGLHITCSYGSGTPTADCSYGGSMRVGPNASYQQIGTILHEMAHAIGVGQHWIWFGPNSPLRETGTRGIWLGERANAVIQFFENSPDSRVTGDGTHFWPYGINGAHEDDHTELLYTEQSLIVQGLGEDGLPPTGGFATPAYTFDVKEGVKYYIKNENETCGLLGNYLSVFKNRMYWNQEKKEDVLAGDEYAWYITFDPVTCYYSFKNVASGLYLTYNSSTGTFALMNETRPSSYEKFQLMASRGNVTVGKGDTQFTGKSYWIVRPESTGNPPCFAAKNSRLTESAAFSINDAATAQRWLLLSEDELEGFENAASTITLANLMLNQTTVAGFSDDVTEYTVEVAPGTDASTLTVKAVKAARFDGTLTVTQTTAVPGKATVTATAADGTEKIYTIHFKVGNYVYRWDGNGATGTVSKPTDFGWSESTNSVNWNTANGGSACRYADNGSDYFTGYTMDGNAYTAGRVLVVRYNNDEQYTYDFSGLQVGHTYTFSFDYGWHNNGVAPAINVYVFNKDADEQITVSPLFEASATKCEMKHGSFEFTVPEGTVSDNFRLGFRNTTGNNDCMLVLGNLTLTDNNPTGISGIPAAGNSLKVVACQGGLRLWNGGAAAKVVVYAMDGRCVATAVVPSGEERFVSLHAGIYIVNGRKVVVN